MTKDYTKWHKLKSKIDTEMKRPGYKEREIWWLRVGQNIGAEEDGKGFNFVRPVLILRGFSKDLFIGVPLSSTAKRSRFYFAFDMNGKESAALLSQTRAFDTARLLGKIGVIEPHDFVKLKTALSALLGLK
jgi:mRNA interferase MazF